jgi:dihydropteroate synthase
MKNTININGKLLSFDEPKIMGIINITPDSFYKDSRFNLGEESFLPKAEKMIAEGCDIFDIGGYSTRPNAIEISISEEIYRISKPIESLKKNFPDLPISIDTFRVEVAKAALDSGANIINDVSGGNLDEQMFDYVISKNIPYILMHMRGEPKTMQKLNNYSDLLPDVFSELFSKANYLKAKGVNDVIIDLGFGFSKDINQNYTLLKNISLFENEYFPTLMGVSRKSMLFKLFETLPEDVLPETSALHLFGLLKNINILRVHDIKAAKRILKLKGIFSP